MPTPAATAAAVDTAVPAPEGDSLDPEARRPVLVSVVQYAGALESDALTLPALIARAAALGADGLELRRGGNDSRLPPLETQAAVVREALREHGLLCTFAGFATLFPTSNSVPADRFLDLDLAAALGAVHLRVFSGPVPADPTNPLWNDAQKFVETAEARGVSIALENFGTAPGASVAELVAVLNRLPSPNLTINADIGNFARAGEDVLIALQTLGSRVGSTHLKNLRRHRGEPGETMEATFLGDPDGVLPLSAIFAALSALPQPILHCFEFEGHATDISVTDTWIRDGLALLKS